MATKNISITEDAYDLLTRYKRPNESFSELIKSHFRKKKHLLDYAGAWEDIPEKDWKDFEEKVKEARTGITKSIKKRTENLKL